ncbi:hypothetical protein EON68_04470, partial [archaeon]
MPDAVLRRIYREIRDKPIAPPLTSLSGAPLQLPPLLSLPRPEVLQAASSLVGVGEPLVVDDWMHGDAVARVLHERGNAVPATTPTTPAEPTKPAMVTASAATSAHAARGCVAVPDEASERDATWLAFQVVWQAATAAALRRTSALPNTLACALASHAHLVSPILVRTSGMPLIVPDVLAQARAEDAACSAAGSVPAVLTAPVTSALTLVEACAAAASDRAFAPGLDTALSHLCQSALEWEADASVAALPDTARRTFVFATHAAAAAAARLACGLLAAQPNAAPRISLSHTAWEWLALLAVRFLSLRVLTARAVALSGAAVQAQLPEGEATLLQLVACSCSSCSCCTSMPPA